MRTEQLFKSIYDYLPRNNEVIYEDESNYSRNRRTLTKLGYFINKQITDWQPDYLIVIERKATAIIRALKEKFFDNSYLTWEKVISSEALEQLPNDFFKNRKILLFDDMMLTGSHLSNKLDLLNNKFKIDPLLLKVAVFGIHNKSSVIQYHQGLKLKYPNTWFYKNLNTPNYLEERNKIIDFLKDSGSLLLDTEHVELRIKTKDVFKLLSALNRTGKTVVYNVNKQERNYKNITVYYQDKWPILNFSKYPSGIIQKNIVKKCRVVQRGIDEFALIPIAYPAIPKDLNGWSENSEIVELFGIVSNDNKSAFYASGLLGALDVLKWTLKDLFASGFNETEIFLPLKEENSITNNDFTLSHLKVMYPYLNLELLDKKLNDIYMKAKEEGKKRRHKIPNRNIFISKTTDNELIEDAEFLLRVIRSELDNKIIEKITNHERICHPLGFRTEDIFNLAKRINIKNPQVISALFDILIDEALLVTHIEEKEIEGKLYKVRTFEPDGEIVSDVIRRSNDILGLYY